MAKKQSKAVINTLNEIFLQEMAGIHRYLHYSFMIMGPHRIPIQAWLRTQATESMTHAILIGEKITALGGHPPVASGNVEETNLHTVEQILNESLAFEESTVKLYSKLAKQAGDDIALEELARSFIRTESEHLDEVRKMLRDAI